MTTHAIGWAAVVTLIVSLLAPLALRPILRRTGVVDVPNARSSHTRPTLRGGGVAPLAALLVGGWIAATYAVDWSPALIAAVITAIAVVMAAVGLIEDFRGLPVRARLAFQLLIGAAGSAALAILLGSPWWAVVPATVFFAGFVNLTNFMDGINGISSLHGFAGGTAFAILGVITGDSWITAGGAVIAAAFIGFLPWNLIPPHIFLGDVGSYLLGAGLAALSIGATFAGANLIAAVAPLGIYLVDTVATLVRRASAGEPIFEAHRTHIYQRLTSTGLSHLIVALIVTVFTIMTSAVGILAAAALLPWWAATALILIVGGVYLSLPRIRGAARLTGPNAEMTSVGDIPVIPARADFAPARWAVIGASGFVGAAVVSAVRSRGYDVVQIQGPRVELDPEGFDGREIAAIASVHAATVDVAAALEGVDVLVNAAGLATPDAAAESVLFGANSLLPAILVAGANRSGVSRLIHLSSAAVQGARDVLDESAEVAPFSPYSRSKALGESAVLAAASAARSDLDVIILRATSVQGPGRETTRRLRSIAQSRMASVAAPGTQPTVVSSLAGLAETVLHIGGTRDPLGAIVLQPWEGLSAADVLTLAGGRRVVHLPGALCRFLVGCGKFASAALPPLAGAVRRVELMWFGQRQQSSLPDRTGHADLARALQVAEETLRAERGGES